MRGQRRAGVREFPFQPALWISIELLRDVNVVWTYTELG